MTNAVPLGKRAELLLNTLRGERHLRRPLLVETLEVLAALGDQTAALNAARALLDRLGELDDAEFEQAILDVLVLTRNSATDTKNAPAAA